MQDASGSIQEAVKVDFNRKRNFQSSVQKVRIYTRILTGCCLFIWISSFCAFLGAEWLHTRQQPQYVKVVSRPPHGITTVLRASGSIAIVVGSFGWWAAMNHRHGFLFTFSCITILSSVMEISCGSVTLSYGGKAGLLMYEDVVRDLKRISDPNADERTDKFLELQKRLHCCGVNSSRDWIKSPWWEAQRSHNTTSVVPATCCTKQSETEDCHTGDPPYEEVHNPALLHKEGCMKRVCAYMNFLFYTTGSLAFTGGLLKFIGFFVLHYLVNLILKYQQMAENEVPERRRIQSNTQLINSIQSNN